jgi:hypothetical protein
LPGCAFLGLQQALHMMRGRVVGCASCGVWCGVVCYTGGLRGQAI